MTTTRKEIAEFELVDHGIENSQYFQGCGLSHTEYEDCATGIGDNPAEAIDDALESLAQGGWETDGMETRIMASEGWESLPVVPSVRVEWRDDSDYETDNSPDEVYCHVSIRVR